MLFLIFVIILKMMNLLLDFGFSQNKICVACFSGHILDTIDVSVASIVYPVICHSYHFCIWYLESFICPFVQLFVCLLQTM